VPFEDRVSVAVNALRPQGCAPVSFVGAGIRHAAGQDAGTRYCRGPAEDVESRYLASREL
jgi:hypothetical protein